MVEEDAEEDVGKVHDNDEDEDEDEDADEDEDNEIVFAPKRRDKTSERDMHACTTTHGNTIQIIVSSRKGMKATRINVRRENVKGSAVPMRVSKRAGAA